MELLKTLNTEQKQAVTHGEGPLLIVAGAGTGKTTVITQRIAWLIAQGKAQSDEILAVTFTDKAAGEMEERIDRLLPLGYLDLWVSTFHAFCQRVLTDHAIDIGLPGDFKLLDQTSQWLLVRQNLDRFNLDYYRPMGNPTKFIHALLKHFSRAKDEAISPQEYLDYVEELKLNLDAAESTGNTKAKKHKNTQPTASQSGEHEENKNDLKLKADGLRLSDISRLEEVANAYHTYQQLLLENNVIDFGDLINYTLTLFQKRPHILEAYRNKFKYILVDEFQDTNWAQYELIKMLATPKNNLTVVADDDQSIYKFRGASVSNVTQFISDFPKSELISLVTNYRSRQEILDMSHTFIKLNNPNRLEAQNLGSKKIDKQLKAYHKSPSTSSGSKAVEYLLFEDQYQEVAGIIEQIEGVLRQPACRRDRAQNDKKEVSYNDFAILIRANSQADIFIQACEAAGVPYQFVASRGLYNKRIILDVINFLKLLDDYHESPSLWRTLNWPVFQLSVRTLIGISHFAKKKAMSLYQALHHFQNQKIIADDTERQEIKRIITLIEHHTKIAQEKKPREVILSFLEESGYLKWLTNKDDAYTHQQVKFLEQFDKKLKQFESSIPDPSIKEFLADIQMEIDSGEQGSLEVDLDSGPETIKIMTVHAAKGLEFKYVFIVNLVDKRFPALDRRDQIELPDELIKEAIPKGDIHIQEERRLFYVALTRAKERIWLTAAENYGGKTKKKPSRFIFELELVGKEQRITSALQGLEDAATKDSTTYHLPPTTYSLPPKFSFTQLKAFENCPYQYRFAHVLKVPVRANYSLSFGKTMHAVLKRFLESFKEREDANQGDLFGGTKGEREKTNNPVPTEKELLKMYEEEWIDDWYESPAHKEEYHQKGIEILKSFHKKTLETPPSVKYLEQGFNLKIQDPNTKRVYTIFGVIDRVDDSGEAEKTELPSVEIIDYKTGSVKNEKTIDKDQLLIYQIAASEVLKLKPKALTYYYLNENKPVSFLGTDKEVNELKERIVEFIGKVKEARFDPDPSPFKCKYCDYRNICEYRQL